MKRYYFYAVVFGLLMAYVLHAQNPPGGGNPFGPSGRAGGGGGTGINTNGGSGTNNIFTTPSVTGGTFANTTNTGSTRASSLLVNDFTVDSSAIFDTSDVSFLQLGNEPIVSGLGLSADNKLMKSIGNPFNFESTDFAADYFDDMPDGALGESLGFNYGIGFSTNGFFNGTGEIITLTNYGGQRSKSLMWFGDNQHSGNDYIRKMPWGTNWVRIRIGVMWRIASDATRPTILTNLWAIGICSGTNAGFGRTHAMVQQNWLGISLGTGTNGVSWDYTNVSQSRLKWYNSAVGMQFNSVTNGIVQNLGTGSGSVGRTISSTTNHYSTFIVDITRSIDTSTNSFAYGVSYISPANTTAGIERRSDKLQLYRYLQRIGIGSGYGQIESETFTTGSLTFGEAFGPLDHINIHSGLMSVTDNVTRNLDQLDMEIRAIMVIRYH